MRERTLIDALLDAVDDLIKSATPSGSEALIVDRETLFKLDMACAAIIQAQAEAVYGVLRD